MYCPYSEINSTTVEQYSYDDEGRIKHKVTIEQFSYPKCHEEECQAFVDGKCTYISEDE